MDIDLEELEIKTKIVDEKKLKAIMGLNFGDFVVKGFRVMISNYENKDGEKLWIVPPSYKDGRGKFHAIFFMPNKKLWAELEKKIRNEYQWQLKEFHKKRFDLKGEIP